MELEKFLISALVFAFSVFFLPELIDAIDAVSASEALKPLLTTTPIILVMVLSIFPIYYAVK